MSPEVGIVAIGRNEGRRLENCLRSLPKDLPIVYVDSGSTDNSVETAITFGATVVALDLSTRFTAARARNEGFWSLVQAHPTIDFVQFIDGDCELASGWLDEAVQFLRSNLKTAVVCGRRREKYSRASTYNLLCDFEWDTPIGLSKCCGGDALMRVTAFRQVGGFNSNVPAGEEPELGVRLRAAGWSIFRLDAEMTYHDAALLKFSQWWKRTARGGYGFALGSHLHGAPPERHWVWESRRAWLWGALLPLSCVALTLLFWPWGLLSFLAFPAQIVRLVVRSRGPIKSRLMLASFQLLARFPECVGQMRFWIDYAWRSDRSDFSYK